jgi:hypothetical protein
MPKQDKETRRARRAPEKEQKKEFRKEERGERRELRQTGRTARAMGEDWAKRRESLAQAPEQALLEQDVGLMAIPGGEEPVPASEAVAINFEEEADAEELAEQQALQQRGREILAERAGSTVEEMKQQPEESEAEYIARLRSHATSTAMGA